MFRGDVVGVVEFNNYFCKVVTRYLAAAKVLGWLSVVCERVKRFPIVVPVLFLSASSQLLEGDVLIIFTHTRSSNCGCCHADVGWSLVVRGCCYSCSN